MKELKPVAWMYEKHIEGIDVPTRVITPYENLTLSDGPYPWAHTPLYAIPDTHRIVSVKLLKTLVGVSYYKDEFMNACEEAQAIIDKEQS